MSSYPRWKYIMVVLVLIISIIYSLPNLYSSYPALEINKNDKIDIYQVINIIDPNIKVENVIQEINNVSEVTVYGEKNFILGNIVCAKISLIEETNKVEFIKHVKKFCKERLQKYKIPVKINIENKQQYNYRFKKIRIQ